LISPSDDEFDVLIKHLRQRILENQGECLFTIGEAGWLTFEKYSKAGLRCSLRYLHYYSAKEEKLFTCGCRPILCGWFGGVKLEYSCCSTKTLGGCFLSQHCIFSSMFGCITDFFTQVIAKLRLLNYLILCAHMLARFQLSYLVCTVHRIFDCHLL